MADRRDSLPPGRSDSPRARGDARSRRCTCPGARQRARSFAPARPRLAGRQLEPEDRTALRHGLDLQRTPVRLRDRAGDEETETGAGLRRASARAPELLEDQLLVLRDDARALILDVDQDLAVVCHRTDPDAPA